MKNKLIFWVIPPLLLWLGIYGIVAEKFPWNSDFMAIVFIVKELFKGKIYLSPDTFLIKYPIIALLSNFLEFGRKYMWLLQMTNGVVMAIGYTWYFADYAKRFISKKIPGIIVMASLFYIATMSYMFYGFTVHPFLRNSEMALMLLFLVIFRKSKIGGFLTIILMHLNDAYFTFVFIVPLLVAEIISASVAKKDLNINKRFIWIAAAVILAYLLRGKVINRSNYFVIYEEQPVFQEWKGIQSSLPIIQESLIGLVGGDIFNLRFFGIQAWAAIGALGLVLLATAGLIKLFADGIKKGEPEMILPLTSTVITTVITLLSTKFEGLNSGRYFIIVCFWLPLGLMYYLWQIRQIKRLFWITILGVIVISGLKTRVIINKNKQNDFWRDNFYHLELVNFLKKNNLKYGYSGFWSAGITTFLSKEEIRVRQIGCGDGVAMPQNWVILDKWYKPEYYSGPSFIFLDTFREDKDSLRSCNEKDMVERFGKPQKVLEFEKDKIYVFDYNVAERF